MFSPVVWRLGNKVVINLMIMIYNRMMMSTMMIMIIATLPPTTAMTLKGTNQDFVQSPDCTANYLQHTYPHSKVQSCEFMCNTSCTHHMQHVALGCEGTAQLFISAEINSHLFHWLIALIGEGGEET